MRYLSNILKLVEYSNSVDKLDRFIVNIIHHELRKVQNKENALQHQFFHLTLVCYHSNSLRHIRDKYEIFDSFKEMIVL